MSNGTHESLPFDEERWRLDTAVWHGVTNGLPALRWAPILDVDRDAVPALLAALATHDVPARAEQLTRHGAPIGRRWRLWVDAVTYARSEDILRVELSNRPDTPTGERSNGAPSSGCSVLADISRERDNDR
jgi:hypothetical protein